MDAEVLECVIGVVVEEVVAEADGNLRSREGGEVAEEGDGSGESCVGG
jgi:hypothetical protein